MIDIFKDAMPKILPKILIGIIGFVVGIVIIRLVTYIAAKAFKKSRIDPTIHKFLISAIKISLMIVLLIIIAGNIGINTSSIITLLGAAGLAISLALKDSLSNISGGILILFTKPFSLGHYIEVGGLAGTADEIGLIHTRLRTLDDKVIFIPNGQLSNAKIINYTALDKSILELKLSISRIDELEKAKSVINSVITDSGLAAFDSPPLIRVSEYTGDSIKIEVKIWVENKNYQELNGYLLERIKQELDKNSISVPCTGLNTNQD